jgi:hypothetical protein
VRLLAIRSIGTSLLQLGFILTLDHAQRSKKKTIVWVLKRKGVGYFNLHVGFKLPRKVNFYMSSTLKPNFSFLDRKKITMARRAQLTDQVILGSISFNATKLYSYVIN